MGEARARTARTVAATVPMNVGLELDDGGLQASGGGFSGPEPDGPEKPGCVVWR